MRKGLILITSALIIGTVGLAIVLILVLLGVSSYLGGFSFEKGNKAKALANVCAEQALMQIRNNTSYTGTNSVTLSTGTCNYTVLNTGGTTREVRADGTSSTTVRRVKVIIDQLSPQIHFTSWQEVVAF